MDTSVTPVLSQSIVLHFLPRKQILTLQAHLMAN